MGLPIARTSIVQVFAQMQVHTLPLLSTLPMGSGAEAMSFNRLLNDYSKSPQSIIMLSSYAGDFAFQSGTQYCSRYTICLSVQVV